MDVGEVDNELERRLFLLLFAIQDPSVLSTGRVARARYFSKAALESAATFFCGLTSRPFRYVER